MTKLLEEAIAQLKTLPINKQDSSLTENLSCRSSLQEDTRDRDRIIA
jgi:hypothetical protein